MRIQKKKDYIDTFGRLKKMSYRQFSDWMESYCKASYELGVLDGDGISVSYFEDDIFSIMVECGVSADVANKVIDRLLEGDGSSEVKY